MLRAIEFERPGKLGAGRGLRLSQQPGYEDSARTGVPASGSRLPAPG
jgi:hypothetical protein